MSDTSTLLRTTDWARTPLGPREQWCEGLRVAAQLCVDATVPMFVWWGRDLIGIYNDAYARLLGLRHPAAFGTSARPRLEPFWHVIGPMVEAVLDRGESVATDPVEVDVSHRRGVPEQAWLTWSYTPIRGADGAVGGLLGVCRDETAGVLAARERDALLARIEGERQRLAAAFAQSPAFVAVLRGPEHVFEFANAPYYELIGREEPIEGRRVADALPEIAEQGFVAILDRVYATGEPYVGNGTRVLVRRGFAAAPVETYLDFVYQPLRDAAGAVEGILAHGIDVTERTRGAQRDQLLLALDKAVRTLSEPEEIMRRVADLLAAGLGVPRCVYAHVEPDGSLRRLVEWGTPPPAKKSRLSDYGESFADCLRAGITFAASDVLEHAPALAVDAFREAGVRALLAAPLVKDGELVGVLAVSEPRPRSWSTEESDLVRIVADRCWESMERARAQAELLESEARFRQLADAMPQIVFAAQPDGHVDYFNRQWYAYTGLPEGEVGAESWRQVHTEEGLERVMEVWPRALASGEPYEIEYPLRRHDGAYRWHLGRALPIRDAGGRIVRWFGTNTDIHDLREIRHAEQAARVELERASRMKDDFLATLSHELRTPLNAVLGWTRILRAKHELTPEVRHGIEVVERNARAQAALIQDLLDMSAIASGKMRLDLAVCDLAAVVRAAVDNVAPAARAKQVAIEVVAPPAARVDVLGDVARLDQILWNLLTNALKFTPSGGHVAVLVEDAGDMAVLHVTDTGAGLAPDFLPHVFDRFRQADASTTRRHGGLGLGLSIVKRLAEAHGGTVRAASEGLGRGATFTLELPRLAARAGLAAPAVRRDVSGLRVLLVEDDEDTAETLQRLLQEQHVEVEIARSADEGMRALGDRAFDVLLSDVGLPGENGYSFMRRVRASDRAIPAAALTAYGRPEDRAQAIEAGFQLHAAKPIEPDALVEIVARLAGRT